MNDERVHFAKRFRHKVVDDWLNNFFNNAKRAF